MQQEAAGGAHKINAILHTMNTPHVASSPVVKRRGGRRVQLDGTRVVLDRVLEHARVAVAEAAVVPEHMVALALYGGGKICRGNS